MRNKESKDMVTMDTILENAAKEGNIPKEQLSILKSALSEVEQIQQGILPRKNGREFLKKMRKQNE